MPPLTTDEAGAVDLRRIVLRPLASPLPVGFFGLAVGSFTLAGLQLKWIPATQGHAVALCVLALVVPLQAVSFVLGLLARDEGAGTAMGVLAGSWFAIALVQLTSEPGETSGALGLLLVASAAALLGPVATAWSSKRIASAVITLTILRFASAGIYELGAGPGWGTATGVIGVVLAAAAWYAGCALALEDAQQRPTLPTFRPLPRSALDIDGADAASLGREAGVRDNL